MSGNSIKKERLPHLDIFRALAIIGVLHVHATSFATVAATESRFYYIINFLNIFFKYGTPSFIFLSSFVLFYNYIDRPLTKDLIKNFYKRRLLYILLPYLLFSIIYFFVRLYQNGLLNSSLDLWAQMPVFFERLARGQNYTHLYFVFISLQFYILFPIFLKLFKSSRFLVRWAVPIGFLLQWGFIILNKYEFQITYKGSLSISYIAYYMLGAYVAMHYDKFKGWFSSTWKQQSARQRTVTVFIWLGWLALALAHVQIWYNNRLYSARYDSLLYELLWNMHTVFSAIVLMQLASWLYNSGWKRIVALLTRIGELSFAIYLVHPLWLFLYREYDPKLNPVTDDYLIWIYGGFITALLVSGVVVQLLMRWVPGVWVLLGSVPRSLKPAPRTRADRKDTVAGDGKKSVDL
ncbi:MULTISPECIES: acyltransferase [Paenibacillus]|uniref:Acyltransferase n=1 Tax=Paenibacillus campinasensis TaxID=66347 RepID=A0A268EFP8_9BACL|nr:MULTISPECIES: acyltransferase [Paenibacillus]PAD71958.1 acyltransferase [Paenibacillus campinasensis]PAK48169.1 acyltransferase [Paenibacillus sp. 7541]